MGTAGTMEMARAAVQQMPERMLKPPEVAAWLGVSLAKAYALMAEGEIPSVKVGGNRRVRLSALHAYIARIEAEGGSPA